MANCVTITPADAPPLQFKDVPVGKIFRLPAESKNVYMKTKPPPPATRFGAVCLQTGIVYPFDDWIECVLLDRRQVTIDTSMEWRL